MAGPASGKERRKEPARRAHDLTIDAPMVRIPTAPREISRGAVGVRYGHLPT
jgi:hypothetical protein